jgi:hypothetical protein
MNAPDMSAARAEKARATGSDWPAPAPLPAGVPEVMPLDPDIIPERFRPWVVDLAERMQIPPDYIAAAQVIAAGSLIGRQVAIQPKCQDSDWLVVPNLFGLVVGRPSLLKTPSMRATLRPLFELEEEARREHEEDMRAHEHGARAGRIVRKNVEKEMERALRKNASTREQIAAQLAEGDDDPAPPVRRRYLTNDCTVEKLGELLRDNPRGILIFRDEITGFLRGLERDGREQDRSFYLEAWDGCGRFTYDRIGRGTVEVDACVVSILGAACPGPLRSWISQKASTGEGDDGFLQRFQVAVWPEHPGEYKDVDRRPSKGAQTRYHEAMTALANVGDEIDVQEQIALGSRDSGLFTKILRFDPEAQEMFTAWRVKLEGLLRARNLEPPWEAHLGKYRSLAPSLALIFSLVDGHRGAVGIDAWLRAEAWIEYLESHARRIYDGFLRPHVLPTHELAGKILAGALPDPFRLRQVYRPQWSGLTTAKEAETAVLELVDLGWLRAADDESGQGRPSVFITSTPSVHG